MNGLMDGDFILKINGISVYGSDHDLVLHKIIEIPEYFDVTVINNSAVCDEIERSLSANLSKNCIDIMKKKPVFKRCDVTLGSKYNAYGFSINKKAKPKYVITSIDPKLAAAATGLQQNDVIGKKNL